MITRGLGTGARSQTLVRVRLIKADCILTAITGVSLLTQLVKAINMEKRHREAFEKFTTTFPSDVVAKWDKMVDDWDADISKPNPYEEPVAGKYRSLSR